MSFQTRMLFQLQKCNWNSYYRSFFFGVNYSMTILFCNITISIEILYSVVMHIAPSQIDFEM